MTTFFTILSIAAFCTCIFLGYKLYKINKKEKRKKQAMQNIQDIFESVVKQHNAALDPKSYFIKGDTIYRNDNKKSTML